ncbi:hypothetical protein DQK91_23680 [Oceanidesulfovibrio marinus]|uniref:Uncharacterized protein n=1 Tax=Oceanidesulfovibrio marinus TaxID=370038 RepID=A0A6P1ZAQ6_9BACT|nr:hypothetical protein DQK91_23680 [Oceanidesulfovibrio marinus]
MITLVISVLVRQITKYYGICTIGDSKISLNTEGMALLSGMIVMLIYAMNDKDDTNEKQRDYKGLCGERVKRIKKNVIWLALMSGFVAAATSYGT